MTAWAAAALAATRDWTKSFLPPPAGETKQLGVARPFFGVSNGVFLIAGGSNFPDAPASEGGTKACRDEIYARLPDGRWRALGRRLPNGAVAEGVPVTTGRGIACIGGTDGRRDLADAFLMAWDPAVGDVTFATLPPLPKTIRTGVGAAWRNQVFVACGEQGGAAANGFWRLDLDRPDAGWTELPPLPGIPRSQPVGAIAVRGRQGPAFHVFGGNGVEKDGPQTALTDGYFFDLSAGGSGVWEPAAPVQPVGWSRPICLLGGSACGTGSIIFCAGGFDKEVWDEAVRQLGRLQGEELAAYRKDYLTRPAASYRWNRWLLVYDAAADAWASADEVPEARCGAAMAVLPGGALIIASGEDKPGSRSPAAFVRQLTARRRK
jgi:cyclically-permuted mutarotase family protein